MTIRFEAVKKFPEWVCPHCGLHPKNKFTVIDRDTCSLNSLSHEFERKVDFSFWQLHCSDCGGASYLYELTLLGESERRSLFIADGCWQSESKASLLCSTEHERWEHERLEEVLFDDGSRADWLGIYRFGPFGDFNMGKLRATYLAKQVARLVEKLSKA